MIPDAVGAILLATITLYATLGGADFGGGFWDLVAGGDQRGRAPRTLIDVSITPVWEGNHVYLIFALVIFWTAFPFGFAAVMTAAALPISLALLGIVLRGAGFAFRKEAASLGLERASGATFAFSSLLTPFFMGTVIGGIAAHQIPADATHAILAAWTTTTSLLTGFLFVGACAYLAAVYLTGEAASRNDRRMQAYFTRRAQAAGVVTGALSLATLAELHTSSPALYAHLTGRALPLVIITGVSGLAVLALLTAGWLRGVRVIAALGVATVIWGWGVAQFPVLLPDTGLTLSNAGAPPTTQAAIIWLFVVAVVLVGPAFLLLYSLQSRQVLGGDGEIALSTTGTGGTGRPGGSARSPGRPSGSGGRAGSASRAAALGLVALGVLIRARRRHGR